VYERVEIFRPRNDLEQEVFVFSMMDLMVEIDEYRYEKRMTTRHKFRPAQSWYRVGRNRGTMGLAGPCVSDDLKVKAVQAFRDRIFYKGYDPPNSGG